MSIVANVVSREGSWVVFDGRGRDSITDEIVSENLVKAQMVNESVCVGYTGTLSVAEAVLGRIHQNSGNLSLATCPSDRIAWFIQEVLTRSSIPDSMKCDFLITGPCSTGQMATYTISKDLTLTSGVPDAISPISCIVLSSGQHNQSLPPYVQSSIEAAGSLSNNAIVNGMKQFCYAVADEDPSVNKNLTVIEIRK